MHQPTPEQIPEDGRHLQRGGLLGTGSSNKADAPGDYPDYLADCEAADEDDDFGPEQEAALR